MAGGSEPRASVLSCPNTSRVVGMGRDTCPRGATYPATCPSWILTRARVVGGPWGPSPCWNHTLHPLGFSWVVKAQEGGLTQTQHAACRESNPSETAGRAEATPATKLPCLPSAPTNHPACTQCPFNDYLTRLSLQWRSEMGPTQRRKDHWQVSSQNWSPTISSLLAKKSSGDATTPPS